MAKIVGVDLDGRRYTSEEFDNIESFRSYIEENRRDIRVVELLDCDRLESLYVDGTNMGLFGGCVNLIMVVDVIGTSKVNDMSCMFFECSSLKGVSLFTTSNVESMVGMFAHCISLESVPCFDTSNVRNMSYMFSRCRSLENVPLFNTSKVEDVEDMFERCSGLKVVPLLDTSNVEYMKNMFERCDNLKSYTLPCDEYNTRSLATKLYKSEKMLEELNELWQK